MLRLFYYFNFNTKSERWVMWLFWKMHEMFEMFISQGRSGSHLLKKPGRRLPDSGWSASGSACCAGHLCGTSSGWILQNNCSWWFPWSVHWCGSCRYSWWFGCCWSNWCSGWGCCRWSHWEQPRWGLWCSWGYICAGQRSSLDSIWIDVHGCGHVHVCTGLPQWLEPSMNHVWLGGWLWLGARGSWHHWVQRQFVLHIAGTSACSDDHGMQHSGWHGRWGDLCQLQLGGPCAWSFGAQLSWLLSGRASQLVNEGGHQWVCSCMPTRQGRGPVLNIWHGWGDLLQPWQLLRLGHYSLGS